ncbi:Panacea domain-containing protein [Celeribacter sp. ULVN23_4]
MQRKMPYNPRKAAQTIAFFAMKEGHAINVLKVIKLVYLADRESVRARGFPIQQEARVSMPYGPVNSVTLGWVNGSYRDNGEWSSVLSDRSNHRVGLCDANMTADDLDELSTHELGILETVWNQFGDMDRFDLADWTHDPNNVPEWENPNGSSVPIPLERMMSAVGLDRPIERAREQESLDQAHNILASL